MFTEKYWLVSEVTSGDTYQFAGYYDLVKPGFNIIVADWVQIASFESAKTLYDVLTLTVPCEIRQWTIVLGLEFLRQTDF